MKAKPCYTKEKFVEVEFNGYTYPLFFNFSLAEQIQSKYSSFENISNALKDGKERLWLFFIFLNEAVKIAKYFGADISKVTIEELELFLTPADHTALRNAIVIAINRIVPDSAGNEEGSNWTAEERSKLSNAPHPDEEEEKN